MGSVMRCIVRCCCDDEDERDDMHSNMHHHHHHHNRMMLMMNDSGLDNNEESNNRGLYSAAAVVPSSPPNFMTTTTIDRSLVARTPPSTSNYPIAAHAQRSSEHDGFAAVAANDDDDDDDSSSRQQRRRDNCCRPTAAAATSRRAVAPVASGGGLENTTTNQAPTSAGFHDFFRHLAERWRVYDSLDTTRSAAAAAAAGVDRQTSIRLTREDVEDAKQSESLLSGMGGRRSFNSPLRQASSFDSSSEILTINPDEIVLPGSLMQQQMALTMSSRQKDSLLLKRVLNDDEDECVICMEGFDPTNPRMPTLCGCGENKTYFHLPCLYQWMEQSRDCPSCRQPLRWEEF